MIKVSKNSWHYRLYVSVWDSPPKDLCRFFWGTIAAMFLHVADFIGGILARLGTGFWRAVLFLFMIGMFIFLAVVIVLATIENPWFPLILMGCMAAVAALLAIVGLLIVYLVDRDKEEQKEGASTPTIAWEFVKAKKQRVCPLIEVIDE